MRRLTILVVSVSVLWAVAPGFAADHPGNDADCASCHTEGAENVEAPKVIPKPPTFWNRLIGSESFQGHPKLSCVGSVQGDGSVTGCHAPEAGGEAFLVKGGAGEPVDLLCGVCHSAERQSGAHHPSYKVDLDGDGTPETLVRPAEGQEVYGALSATGARFDALDFDVGPDGSRKLLVRIPLETVTETVAGVPVEESDVVTCTSCHNPHFGYLVEVGSQEDLARAKAAREKGDALLRARDYDNTLCEGCH